MTTREAARAQLESLPDEAIERLLPMIRALAEEGDRPENREHILARLLQIRIDAPPDFSERLDLYASGERGIGGVR